ncbi:hypothetical protein GJW-30_1_02026 [Variibacter gotjawalensis]|uniref:Uncharacterized protein n=1 Tax=Variibacter gotjawalensis TaxID=1333996 RepID=A0A0S3PU43_9BRAD|nr:hypothetical protein [Variibacter gotjawalensis]RZS45818.1 hypothetical protein EV661_4143 [Variibacter gotjawalensis]BAT59493.1 hypothetical protein GJW-30_1_02026 [Variibacter gotjawalensis]
MRRPPLRESRLISEQLIRRANLGRTSTLTPESARICTLALQLALATPSRAKVLSVICGNKSCSQSVECMPCVMKANEIMNLYEEGGDARLC